MEMLNPVARYIVLYGGTRREGNLQLNEFKNKSNTKYSEAKMSVLFLTAIEKQVLLLNILISQ